MPAGWGCTPRRPKRDFYDQRRDQWLTGQGFQLLRFSNDSILHEMDGVLTTIAQSLAGHAKENTPL
jgi:very-short-patch-repair endonuclease